MSSSVERAALLLASNQFKLKVLRYPHMVTHGLKIDFFVPHCASLENVGLLRTPHRTEIAGSAFQQSSRTISQAALVLSAHGYMTMIDCYKDWANNTDDASAALRELGKGLLEDHRTNASGHGVHAYVGDYFFVHYRDATVLYENGFLRDVAEDESFEEYAFIKMRAALAE